ncbi:hypothetical protein ES319_A12G204400v1 [Gossypium barbadense]|uniref:Uncharacterized protein n=1 Tax=Gossypium barbadense TaxID=3634 RepID=A0A5J5TD81_GOSBA|nr:hypothetical protein ES319_A12G204400v1 [Gossypium barbadense]
MPFFLFLLYCVFIFISASLFSIRVQIKMSIKHMKKVQICSRLIGCSKLFYVFSPQSLLNKNDYE